MFLLGESLWRKYGVSNVGIFEAISYKLRSNSVAQCFMRSCQDFLATKERIYTKKEFACRANRRKLSFRKTQQRFRHSFQMH